LKLPNLESALVEERKITAYLLSEENSGGKAAFFIGFGFSAMKWHELRRALLEHASIHEVTRVFRTTHGVKYIIEGYLQTPDGRFPQVRSVWIADAGNEVPRRVTAYPLEGMNQ
jgi:hypothetical protein